jgi:hypothetical protein
MPSSVNPNEISLLRDRLYHLGADTVTYYETDPEREPRVRVTWAPDVNVVGVALFGQVGGAFEDAERKLRAAVAERHPTVTLPE